jgi:parvulin-like peptidyl-prolyl isomerase
MAPCIQARARPPLLIGLALLALASPPGAAQQELRGVGGERAPSAASAAPDAVLVIDGEEVPAAAYAAWLIEEVGPPLVREFAVGWALEREAVRRGLEVSAADLEARLAEELRVRIDGAFHGRREEWLEELARLGRSEAGHVRQREGELRPLLAATALATAGRVVPQEKVERDWELQYGPRGRAFDLELLEVAVLVEAPSDGVWSRDAFELQIEAARRRGLERARELRARLEAGEDFASLAREVSDDEDTRAAGGRLQRFRQFGWPTDFVEALFELERGQLSQPLFARGGWWLVRVRDWVDTPLESVRAELVRRLEARGPEQDEVGAVWNAVAQRIQVEVQPGMLQPPPGDSAERPDPVALTVDGEPIARSEYARWLLGVRGEASWQPFAEAWLVERRAREVGVDVTPQELDARVRMELDRLIAQSYQGDRAVWRAYLAASGSDEELFLRQLAGRQRLTLLVEKLILREREVAAADVEARFRRLYGPDGRRVRARVILLEIPRPELPSGLSKEQAEALLRGALEARRRDALELLERARAGEDFATLARRFSDESLTRERGGELEGGFQPDGWPPEVSEAVLALPRGGLSEPLLVERWWALFEVVDLETVSLEDVRERLAEELRSARPTTPEVAGYRNTLLQAARIEVLPGMSR